MNRRRHGISILEVLIATIVLAVSATMLLRMISAGERNGRRAEERVYAQLQAQSILDQLTAGGLPAVAVEQEIIPGEVGWSYAIAVDETDLESLILVTLRIFHSRTARPDDEQSLDSAPDPDAREVYSIRRILRIANSPSDPQTESTIGGFE